MFAFNGAAMARSAAPGNMKNSSAAPGKIKKRWKGPKFQQCEVLHSYTINDTEVTVIAAVQHELGATWTLEIDGLRYQLLAQGQTVLLISEQDGLVAGWTSGGEEAVVFDAEGLLEHDGTLSVVAEFYDEVVAALLDPAFINTLGQNSFSSGNRNPWILEPFSWPAALTSVSPEAPPPTRTAVRPQPHHGVSGGTARCLVVSTMEKTRNLKPPLDGKPKLPHRPHPNLLLVGAGLFFIRTWTKSVRLRSHRSDDRVRATAKWSSR